MRVTKQGLHSQVRVLNMLLKRPETMFAENDSWQLGHIMLDKDATGFQLEEVASHYGSTNHLSNRMSASEMDNYLTGMLRGVGLTVKV
jgi:hypothetical protein